MSRPEMLAHPIRFLRSSRMARFLLVGAYNTLFGYVVFVALYYWLGDEVHYNVVLFISYIISVTNSYLLQRRFVFGSRARPLAEFIRFNVVNFVAMLINMGLLSLAVEHVTRNVAIAQALALVATTAFIYVAHTLFSFRRAGTDR